MKEYTAYIPEIRFVDVDALGHVNNATYFTYFEQARIHFFRELIGREWNWDETGLLVAHNEIDYMKPVLFRDVIKIYIGCTHIGGKSFTLSYTLRRQLSQGDEIVAQGSSVMVCFNHHTKQTRTIPEEWLGSLEELLSLGK